LALEHTLALLLLLLLLLLRRWDVKEAINKHYNFH
jgi:hypothetical protein